MTTLTKKDEADKALRAARSLLFRAIALYGPDMVGTASGKALMLNICEWEQGVAAFVGDASDSSPSLVVHADWCSRLTQPPAIDNGNCLRCAPVYDGAPPKEAPHGK